MEYHFDPITEKDRAPVADIFDWYIENSFAAYPTYKAGDKLFDMLLNIAEGYPVVAVKTDAGQTVGFGLLHPINPSDTLRGAAEIAYFLAPDHTRRGIGKAMLDHLIAEARKRKIHTILASISSLNEPSLNFHLKYGFAECGRFQRVGKKFGQEFDLVWMQRMI